MRLIFPSSFLFLLLFFIFLQAFVFRGRLLPHICRIGCYHQARSYFDCPSPIYLLCYVFRRCL
jgi:hypothetical protein